MAEAMREWTGEDLDHLRALQAAGRDAEAIAAELGRDRGDVEERLALLVPFDPSEPAMGPDEEGDVIPTAGRRADDPAAWVSGD